MIPAFFPEDAPPGEKMLYRALARSKDTDEWIVLHSLGIADHVKNPEGEADFVVIAPDLGVLVIEVKSHDYVHFEEVSGTWASQKPDTRGPFKQASQAMHSIRQYLERKQVELRSVPMLSAAWFTAVRARTMLPSLIGMARLGGARLRGSEERSDRSDPAHLQGGHRASRRDVPRFLLWRRWSRRRSRQTDRAAPAPELRSWCCRG